MHNLEAIIDYNMDGMEAKAFKICLLWEMITKAELPGYQAERLRAGDPRKSILFKYCYKLARETNGIIPDPDYRYYVLAQIQILKSLKTGDVHALINPQCLVGDKAWKRWKLWQNKFLKKLAKKDIPQKTITAIPSKIRIDLQHTHDFITQKFGDKEPTYTEFQCAFKEGFIVKWVALSKISLFYVILSPFVKKVLNNKNPSDYFTRDLSVYETGLTDEIKEKFKEIFAYEF